MELPTLLIEKTVNHKLQLGEKIMISNASVPITNQEKLEATEEQLVQFFKGS